MSNVDEDGDGIFIIPEFEPEDNINVLDYSRPLDVHTSSDYPEVDEFIDTIYSEQFDGQGNETIQKKHIKTVLLDIYVAWLQDPELKIAFHRNVDFYNAGSRYNELHISRTTIPVVDRLIAVGLVEQQIGFLDRRPGGQGRMSRIWPTPLLIKLFQEVAWTPEVVTSHPDRECIVLRDENKLNLEYKDTDATSEMRRMLQEYNELIGQTFIDIPTLEENWVVSEDDEAPAPNERVFVSQQEKFVSRIFNRGSFDLGGRFYGGWWQRISQENRGRMFMDDWPVSEIDYSGLHIVLLYAEQGYSYWDEFGFDPYVIPTPDFVTSDHDCRDICKKVLLVGINSQDDRATFNAFRQQAADGSYKKRLTNEQLSTILDSLRDLHPIISGSIANDAGIRLMNTDSHITGHILGHFTSQKNIPILPIHDSYLVPYGMEDELIRAMNDAFSAITGITGVNVREETHRPHNWISESGEDGAGASLEELNARIDPPKSERYARAFDQFITYHNKPRVAHWVDQRE